MKLYKSLSRLKQLTGCLYLFTLCIYGQFDANLYKQVKPLSPQESIKTIEIPAGYKLQLVASEPMISEPVLCVWDGNGRMYVAEMNTYMQDADGSSQMQATSRVLRLEDTNGDGKMDKSTVFADNLLLPRMILPLDDRVIIGTTNTLDMYAYTDTDGDGKADKKEMWWAGGKAGGNMEHQASGLVWNIDNWIYMTMTHKRLRFTDGKVKVGKLPKQQSQWGMDCDDRGRVYSCFSGKEKSFQNFQQPWKYGYYSMKGELESGFDTVWPVDNIPDTQGGRRRLREDNTLNHFTAGCGHSIYRDSFMPDLTGNLFICEPVGRLVRRATVEMKDGQRILHNATPESEFIRSTDANFRPVNTKMGPDGCLYIVDMYRGIIQEGNWTKKGSYLRKVIDQYGLEKNIGMGRIYRLVREDGKRRMEKPQMLKESSEQLLKHLSHNNGWWRDTARKLIILRAAKDLAPKLEKMLKDSSLPVHARVSALWTLEGLGVLRDHHVTSGLADSNIDLIIAAAQAGESLLKETNALLKEAYIKASKANISEEVKLQIYLSFSKFYQGADKMKLMALVLDDVKEGSPRAWFAQSYYAQKKKEEAEATRMAIFRKQNAALAESFSKGKNNYQTVCVACHGENGQGTPMAGTNTTLGAPLAGSSRVLKSIEQLGRIALHGLSGPIEGKTYAGAMQPLASQSDAWLADTLTYIRNEWGNKAPMVLPEDIAALRRQTASRQTAWTVEELKPWDFDDYRDRHLWKVDASHGKENLKDALDNNMKSSWSSGRKQHSSMWLSIATRTPLRLSGVQINHQSTRKNLPDSVKVEVSDDGRKWTVVVDDYLIGSAAGKIMFDKTVKTKHVKIWIKKGNHREQWRIQELTLIP